MPGSRRSRETTQNHSPEEPDKNRAGKRLRLSNEQVAMSADEEKQPELRLQLTELETKVFDIILRTCEKFQLPTQARAAGGWVRDKLLGLESDDIDIALDGMMGQDFAVKVNEYLSNLGEEVHEVGVIRSNPDQSKHLETATLHVLGVSLDCTNTRTESYSDCSRVPEIAMGTPSEDALRRDFTFNALFYNIHTGLVEDFTGSGIEDLHAGVVRTPLPPLQTFKDDPLRVLRAARFAGRFHFRPLDALCEAAADPGVTQLLEAKISRERVGIEVWKMFQGHWHPEHAGRPDLALAHESRCVALSLGLIMDWGLYHIVFQVPEEYVEEPEGVFVRLEPEPSKQALVARDSLARIARLLEAPPPSVPKDVLDDEARRTARLSALLLPLFGKMPPGPVKRSALSSLKHVVLVSLKLPRKLADRTDAAVRSAHALCRLADEWASDLLSSEKLRVRAGQLLQQTRDDYSIVALLSLVLAELSGDPEASNRILRILSWISEDAQLIGCWQAVPLFNGNVIKKRFPTLRSTLLGKAMELQKNQFYLKPLQGESEREAELSALLQKFAESEDGASVDLVDLVINA